MNSREFESARQRVKSVSSRHSLPLVVLSVGLGLGQLAFIRWGDAHLAAWRTALYGVVFLGYAAAVVVLLVRFDRAVRRATPACPACARPLKGMSERVAAATGRCDQCGGIVISDHPSFAAPLSNGE